MKWTTPQRVSSVFDEHYWEVWYRRKRNFRDKIAYKKSAMHSVKKGKRLLELREIEMQREAIAKAQETWLKTVWMVGALSGFKDLKNSKQLARLKMAKRRKKGSPSRRRINSEEGGLSPGGATSPGGNSPGGISSPGGVSPGGVSPGGANPGGANLGGASPGAGGLIFLSIQYTCSLFPNLKFSNGVFILQYFNLHSAFSFFATEEEGETEEKNAIEEQELKAQIVDFNYSVFIEEY